MESGGSVEWNKTSGNRGNSVERSINSLCRNNSGNRGNSVERVIVSEGKCNEDENSQKKRKIKSPQKKLKRE